MTGSWPPASSTNSACRTNGCVGRVFGYFFFGLGVFLLLLIIYAMVSRLAN